MKKHVLQRKLSKILSCLMVVALYGCGSQTYIQTITLADRNNKDITTEWSDGKLWAYQSDDDYAIGMALSSAKDDIGLKQLNLIVENKTDEPLVFDPHAISVIMENSESVEARYTIEYPIRQNLDMSLYGGGENIYQLSKMAERGDSIEQIGYLKKNTIYPGNGIIGYSNFLIKGSDTGIMHVVVPIGERIFEFQWYAGAEFAPAYTYVSPNDISIIDYSGDIKQEKEGDKVWACRNDGNFAIKAALCTSQYDKNNCQLNIQVKNLKGEGVVFDPNKIEANFVSGVIVKDLDTYGFCSTKNVGRTETQQDVVGFMNVQRFRGKGVLAINIPIGDDTYTFQWYVGETEYGRTLKYASPQDVLIIDYSGNIRQEMSDDKMWACQNDGNFAIGAALCTSEHDKKNYQLNIRVKDLKGENVIFDPNKIEANFVSGAIVKDLDTYGFCSTKNVSQTKLSKIS